MPVLTPGSPIADSPGPAYVPGMAGVGISKLFCDVWFIYSADMLVSIAPRGDIAFSDGYAGGIDPIDYSF